MKDPADKSTIELFVHKHCPVCFSLVLLRPNLHQPLKTLMGWWLFFRVLKVRGYSERHDARRRKGGSVPAQNEYVTHFKSPHTITSGLLTHSEQKQGFFHD